MPRFYFLDPLALSGALEQTLHEPFRRRADQIDQAELIPVDVYRDGDSIVIEGALPGARQEDIEISCEEGLLTIQASIPERTRERDYAVREIPRGALSRSLALPPDSKPEAAKASYQDGVLRIVVPGAPSPKGHTIRIETAGRPEGGSGIVMDKRQADQIVDAVKGQDYSEVEGRRKGRGRPAGP
jgi:HSP20 family protein